MKDAFLYAFRKSIPVLIGFIPVGLAYGVLMQTSGYNWLWTAGCSIFVLAGSFQYLLVDFLIEGAPLLTVAVMALLVNSRHMFYGLPFIEKWRDYGISKFWLIYTLADESFSIHVANDFDDGNPKHKKLTYLFTGSFIFFYWVSITVVGAFLGSLIKFDTTGIDFALTALFIVILINQLKAAEGTRLPAIMAFTSSIVCLILLGPAKFILPSLLITVILLMAARGKIESSMKSFRETQLLGAQEVEND